MWPCGGSLPCPSSARALRGLCIPSSHWLLLQLLGFTSALLQQEKKKKKPTTQRVISSPPFLPIYQGTSANPGINQRALQLLFSEVRSKASDWDYAITVSVAEIYNEALRYAKSWGS